MGKFSFKHSRLVFGIIICSLVSAASWGIVHHIRFGKEISQWKTIHNSGNNVSFVINWKVKYWSTHVFALNGGLNTKDAYDFHLLGGDHYPFFVWASDIKQDLKVGDVLKLKGKATGGDRPGSPIWVVPTDIKIVGFEEVESNLGD
jgi:hypothetical protein